MRPSLTLACLIALCGGPVLAQAPRAAAPAPAPAPDEKVIAAAKKEGVVSIYTSANVEDMGLLSAAFEKKYGVKLRVWRASSEQVLQRGVVEARGGRYDADLFETGGGAMEALHREKLLQPMNPPGGSDLDPAALTAHREWTGTRYNIFFPG
jgi:iron(III) transport system substrate-binding protein